MNAGTFETLHDLVVGGPVARPLELETSVTPGLDAPVGGGTVLEVELAVPVTVSVDRQGVSLALYASDVAGAIADAGVELSPLGRVDPPPNTPLGDTEMISIARVRRREENVNVVLEHERREERTDELLEGERRGSARARRAAPRHLRGGAGRWG